MFTDEYFMKQALLQANIAFSKNEVPVGAIIVHNNKIISKAYNLVETLSDPTAHAEMQAITSATNHIGGKFLKKCTLYVTLEPCVMCAGAAYWAQIGKIVFGAFDEKKTHLQLLSQILPAKTEVIGGILEIECNTLLKSFFKKLR